MKTLPIIISSIAIALSSQAQVVAESNNPLACATEVFALPSTPFMHKIRPANPYAAVSVSGLPKGLHWNNDRRLVQGTSPEAGTYTYTVTLDENDGTRQIPVTLTVSPDLQQPTPLMGWLSWNVVERNISDSVVCAAADALISSGLADAGYRYVVMDDYWHAPTRDSITGAPVPDPVKFPRGLNAVSDHVHSKGLKFGIYSDAGTKTCAGMFGSYGSEKIDAQSYADWGVDLLKYDYCFTEGAESADSALVRYSAMGDALRATGRPILYYMCEWGPRKPWLWGHKTGASCWRATFDTRDGWVGENGGIGMVQSVSDMKDLWPYSGVNRFNDADMMCVGIHGTGHSSSHLIKGTPGMSDDEYTSQMAMWCMWSSPLTLSFDITKPIDPKDLALMTNPELISIDQDPLGQQAEFVFETSQGVQLYFKDLADGSVAVAVLNMGEQPADYTIDFGQIEALNPKATYKVRDAIERKDLPQAKGHINVDVRPHATRVLVLRK